MRFLREQQNLNQVERWKLERHPLDVRQAVLERYAHEGPEAIASVPGEQERLKWVGLYPQRQGGDAFMVRIKVPGGHLTAEQARTIGELATTHARGPEPSPVFGQGFLDLTTRQDIQLHWIRIGEVPELWRRLEAVGITTTQACGDSARNVLCCPVSGLDADEVLDAYPVARAISDFFTGNREYANLPRKFKMSVTGCREDCAKAEINDVGLWPARQADGTVGFNLLVGGGLSDGPRMASDVDVFLRPEQTVECTRAIAQLFGELGDRENRWTCRMRYLVQELGPEGFREELQRRVAFPLTPAGETLTRRHRGDHVGVHRQTQPGCTGQRSLLHLEMKPRYEPNHRTGKKREDHVQPQISAQRLAFKLQLPGQEAGCNRGQRCNRRHNRGVISGVQQGEVFSPDCQHIEYYADDNESDGKVYRCHMLRVLGEEG